MVDDVPSEPVPPPPPYLPRQLVWEVVLLLAVLGGFGLAARRVPLVEEGDLLWTLAYLGLLATGLALSLRTAAPNLAVSSLAVASTLVYAHLAVNAGWPPAAAALAAVVVAGLVGAALWLAGEVLSAPAWAVSLAAVPVLSSIALAIELPSGYYDGTEPLPAGFAPSSAGLWFGLFLAASVGGGGLLAVPASRRWLLARLPDHGEHQRWALRGIGLIGSSLLAGVAGLVAVLFLGRPPLVGNAQYGVPTFTFLDLLLVLAAVLLGGVAIHGYRGGVAGTALGVALLSITVTWVDLERVGVWLPWLVLGLALVVGLGAQRVLSGGPDSRLTNAPGVPDPSDEATEDEPM